MTCWSGLLALVGHRVDRKHPVSRRSGDDIRQLILHADDELAGRRSCDVPSSNDRPAPPLRNRTTRCSPPQPEDNRIAQRAKIWRQRREARFGAGRRIDDSCMIAGDYQHASMQAHISSLQESRDERKISASNRSVSERWRTAEVLLPVLGRDPIPQQLGLKTRLNCLP